MAGWRQAVIEKRYLAERAEANDPVRVAVVGPGFMGRALVRHIESSVPGMQVVAVVARTLASARSAFSGLVPDEQVCDVIDSDSLDEVVAAGARACTVRTPAPLGAVAPEVIVDATGALEAGASLALDAIEKGKPLVTLNAEVEGTVGPILDVLASESGVTRTIADGDQPGVQLRLAGYAASVGIIPRVLGNIKGLQDVRRTPMTQASFAARWRQNVAMVTSFADGTKISFEQALVANALGLTMQRSDQLGRHFPAHVDTLTTQYDLEDLRRVGGVVDFVVGAQPGPGVYCLGEARDSEAEPFLELFKLGRGPLYSLYVPYHLCHLEVPRTIASVAGFQVGLGSALNGPRVEVCALAKADLERGVALDGIGGFHTYGRMMDAREFRSGGYLPMGIAAGCTLLRDVKADHVLRYQDVRIPAGRVIDHLRVQQESKWGPLR
jgi:predicted homoserine dehydrogenase-like protein